MEGRQPGFWDMEERLRELSAQGYPLKKLGTMVNFEIFRGELDAAVRRRDRSKGGRPPFDPVLEFRMLVLQAMHGLSPAQTDYLGADRLSCMRFCGLGPGDAVPDANTLFSHPAPIAARCPQGADRGGRARRVVRAAGPGDHRGGLPADGWADRGRHAGGAAPPEEHGGQKGSDQGG
ncbi:MAG: transposase [Pseudomonadota bacterium]